MYYILRLIICYWGVCYIFQAFNVGNFEIRFIVVSISRERRIVQLFYVTCSSIGRQTFFSSSFFFFSHFTLLSFKMMKPRAGKSLVKMAVIALALLPNLILAQQESDERAYFSTLVYNHSIYAVGGTIVNYINYSKSIYLK